MRAIEFLTEARGLFGRKVGDTFVNDKTKEELRLQSIEMFPRPVPNSEYKSEEQMMQVYEKLTKKADVVGSNERNPRARAFALATLQYPDGSIEKWVRWFIKVPQNIVTSWQSSEYPAGWKLKSASAQKAVSGMAPQDLIKTDAPFKTIPQILQQLQKNGASPEIMEGMNQVANGEMPVFAGQKENLTGIRDYLGEIIGPIALMKGMVGGEADKAAAEILQAPFGKSQVVWPQSRTTGLIDSYFIGPNGRKLGISSKGDKGANASVNNILEAINKAKIDNSPLIKKYREQIDLIDTIGQNDSKEGPIQLALKLKMIPKTLAEEIRQYLLQPTKNFRNLSKAARKLFDEYDADRKNSAYNVGYHLLTSLVTRVCNEINSNQDFSEACLAFLNQSSIVQVYTNAKTKGDDVEITGFSSVYPPNFSGSVVLTKKPYSATVIKGKLTFDYKKTNKIEPEVAADPVVSTTEEPKAKKPAKPISTLKAKSKDVKQIKSKAKAAVGRTKR